MNNIGDLCRNLSDLKAADIGRLVDMSRLLPLASDIAHGRGKIYVKNKENTGFVLVAESYPHTNYTPKEVGRLGDSFKKYEEPLVEVTFATGESTSGKRQWDLTEAEIDVQSWPIYLNSKTEVGAVLLFEWPPSFSLESYFSLLSEAAYDFFSGGLRYEGLISSEITNQDGFLLLNQDGKIIWANELAEQLYRPYGVGHLIGRWYYEKILGLKGFSRVLQTMKPIEFMEKMGVNTWDLRYLPIIRESQMVKIAVIISDKTAILKKEKEVKTKEILIQETNHRVKNNLQTIAGLLRMQARRSEVEEVKKALNESIQRIYSMAMVHEFLAHRIEGKIKLSELIHSLLLMGTSRVSICEESKAAEILLNSDEASAVALILNELIQNGIDHGKKDSIEICWKEQDGEVFICVSNMVDSNEVVNFEKSDRLGLRIVQMLAEETLNGNFKTNQEEQTLYCELSFHRGGL